MVVADEAPRAVEYAAAMSRRLKAALADQAISTLAVELDLARSTIYDILAGKTWPDLVTLVALQESLGVPLWPEWSAEA